MKVWFAPCIGAPSIYKVVILFVVILEFKDENVSGDIDDDAKNCIVSLLTLLKSVNTDGNIANIFPFVVLRSSEKSYPIYNLLRISILFFINILFVVMLIEFKELDVILVFVIVWRVDVPANKNPVVWFVLLLDPKIAKDVFTKFAHDKLEFIIFGIVEFVVDIFRLWIKLHWILPLDTFVEFTEFINDKEFTLILFDVILSTLKELDVILDVIIFELLIFIKEALDEIILDDVILDDNILLIKPDPDVKLFVFKELDEIFVITPEFDINDDILALIPFILDIFPFPDDILIDIIEVDVKLETLILDDTKLFEIIELADIFTIELLEHCNVDVDILDDKILLITPDPDVILLVFKDTVEILLIFPEFDISDEMVTLTPFIFDIVPLPDDILLVIIEFVVIFVFDIFEILALLQLILDDVIFVILEFEPVADINNKLDILELTIVPLVIIEFNSEADDENIAVLLTVVEITVPILEIIERTFENDTFEDNRFVDVTFWESKLELVIFVDIKLSLVILTILP